MPENIENMNQRDIDLDIERGVPFLRGISAMRPVQRIMLSRGYTAQDHRDGWTSLLRLMGYNPDDQLAVPTDPVVAQQAITELDLWDGPNFILSKVALEHLHPAQAKYVFNGLTQQSGAASISSVKIYCDRVAALRDGTDADRAGSREDDAAAVATLEKRGIFNPEIETRLRGFIQQATELDTSTAPVEDDSSSVEYLETAHRFHAWLTDWRETARVAISRRDYQIRLGLAQRRKKKPTE